MRLALAQLDPTVGDLAGNAALIRAAVERAAAQGAELVVSPELAICGYPPEDLVLRPTFVAACEAAVAELAVGLPVPVLVGGRVVAVVDAGGDVAELVAPRGHPQESRPSW